MLRAVLKDRLYIYAPGVYKDQLTALASFRRRGRVPTGEQRTVTFWTGGQAGISIPRGLLPRAKAIVPLEVQDQRLTLPPIDFGWRGSLFPYQAQAARSIYQQEGGMLEAPPAAGKTEMGMAMIAIWRQPACWLTHTTDLVNQSAERAEKLFNLPRRAIGRVSEGEATFGTHLTVASIQMLDKRPDVVRDLSKRVGTLVIDEVHHAAAVTWANTISQFPARYRLGITATPSREDGLGPLVNALVGPGYTKIPLELLIKLGRLVAPQVMVVPTGFAAPAGVEWGTLQLARALDPQRNWLLCNLAARDFRKGKRMLVIVDRRRHAAILEQVLRQYFHLPAVAVSGPTPQAAREAAYRQAKEHKVLLIGTKLTDEGLDLPAMDCLVMGAAGRSATATYQRSGRIMRAWEGKSEAILYDLADPLTPALAVQAAIRIGTYQSLGFRVQRVAVSYGQTKTLV